MQRASFMILAISLVMRLKLLYKDFPLKVDYSKIKARLPKVIVVLITNENLNISLLKALSTLYLEIKIRDVRYFNLRVIIK